MTGGEDFRRHCVAAVLLAAALMGLALLGYSGRDRLAEIAILVIFAMSLDLLVGFTGLVSLGHALFFGLGAYALAGLTTMAKIPPSLAMPLAILAAAIAAFLVGILAIRVRGVFFIMITLAFGQMGWAYFQRSRTFGGIGGISGVGQPDLGAIGLSLANPADMALIAIIAAALVYLGMARVTASPFGRMLVAVHQNESRARALGLPVQRYKLAAFTLAGAIAGLAGVLAAERTNFVSPDLLVWTVSGEVLIMVIVGGLGTIVGPALGAAVWVLLRDYLSAVTPYWMLAMGLFFVAVVLFADEGLYGLAARISRRSTRDA
ncbi:MAG TPA: branched-chain amino acid ABC transporter permease [Stellaceae bacterium]|nr:branched-chain amino acid ABC transporter permease [Stellaceae bacterium]